MPCTSPYFDGALFNFMDIAQVEAPIAQLGAPELFGARGKLPPPPLGGPVCCPHCSMLSTILFSIVIPDSGSIMLSTINSVGSSTLFSSILNRFCTFSRLLFTKGTVANCKLESERQFILKTLLLVFR